MATLVEVEWRLAGLPPRVPDSVAVLDIEIPTSIVHRYIIVAITGDAAEFGILVERIAAGGVGDEREKVLVAQVVNPWPWGLRISDDILAMLVVEMTITFLLFHYFDCFLS
jgi:hypothetical protein